MTATQTGRSDLGREHKQHASRYLSRVTCALALLTFSQLSRAEITCPPIFTDHMVLQRDKPISVWGTANPGEQVSVSFAGKLQHTTADYAGDWKLSLPPLAASFEARTLTISGDNTLNFEDVLVGEVWLLSGQSNMDKPLGERRGQKPTLGYPEVLEEADIPELRLFRMPNNIKISDPSMEKRWQPCTPETIETMQFSAAGFYFGQKLTEELKVPIGLIHAAYGGTMIEAWTPRFAFEQDADLAPLLERPYFSWVKGVQATELYESMIAPLAPYSLRGFLWYQGETNLMDGDAEIYGTKLRALIDSWREVWSMPNAPFYLAQLAPFTYSEWIGSKSLTDTALPLFWEIQNSVAQSTSQAGLIPTFDLVTDIRDIHPVNKREVGYRFARLALEKTYGKSGLRSEQPRLKSLSAKRNGTLVLHLANTQNSPITSGQVKPELIEIAGDDLLYHPAVATERAGKIILKSDKVNAPKYARYAWHETAAPSPTADERLPLYPFRTDNETLFALRPQYHNSIHINLSNSEGAVSNWINWELADNPKSSITIDKLTASLESTGRQQLSWESIPPNKELANRVSNDSATTIEGESLQLTLTGLNEGVHSIATYHNISSASRQSPIDILLNGQLVGNATPTVGAIGRYEMETFFHEFEVNANEPTVFEFRPSIDSGVSVLNAFSLQIGNPKKQARNLYPKNGEALDYSAKPIEIQWEAPPGDVQYRLYIDSSEDPEKALKKLREAGPHSSSCKGVTRATNHSIAPSSKKDSSTDISYAWRVDCIHPNGKVTRGEVHVFVVKASRDLEPTLANVDNTVSNISPN